MVFEGPHLGVRRGDGIGNPSNKAERERQGGGHTRMGDMYRGSRKRRASSPPATAAEATEGMAGASAAVPVLGTYTAKGLTLRGHPGPPHVRRGQRHCRRC